MPTSASTATFDDDRDARALDRRTSRPRPSSTRSSARSSVHDLDDLRAAAPATTVAFALAKRTLDNYFRDDDGQRRSPGSSRSSSRSRKRWLDECVTLQGRHLPAAAPARRVQPRRRRAHLPRDRRGDRRREAARCRSCGPTTRSARPATSTSTRPRTVLHDRADKCHVNHVVARHRAGSRSWPRCSKRCPRCVATSRTRASASRSRTRSTASAATTSPTSSSASTTATARTTC